MPICAGYSFAITYLVLALAPCLYSIIFVDRSEECRKYQDFMITGASFLIVQLPFWRNLPILLFIQLSNTMSQPFATACFIIEIPYILTGAYLSVNGMSLYDAIDDPEQKCSPGAMGFYMLFELSLSTLLFGCLWMLSISYFVDIVIVTARRRLKFAATSISVATCIILISASVAVISNDIQAVEEPILAWIVVGSINLILFFAAFFVLVSLSPDLLSESKCKVLSGFLAFIYLPFNVFWFMKGLSWMSAAVGSPALQYTNSIYLILLIYEWTICFLLFCVLILSYLVFTNRITSQNLFRPDVQHFPFEVDAASMHPQQQNNIELVERLHSVNFQPHTHSNSFKEKGVCPICWDHFQEGQKVIYLDECSHVFHGGCIKQWALKNATCPTCRRPITAAENKSLGNPVQE